MKWTVSFLCVVILFGCHPNKETERTSDPNRTRSVTLDTTPAGNYRLFVDGIPMFIKGAGCEFGDIALLAEHGGNSFRTWRVDNGKQSAQEVLDEAQKNGLMVMMGLDLGRERHGYDYNDTAWVHSQLKQIRSEVESIKDHPALLGWGVGNELNLNAENLKVWDAVEDIARMIKRVDGRHVVTTMLSGIDKRNVSYIETHCPDLDFLSIQMYGDIQNLHERIRESGYHGPYLITEWGAVGHWEMPATPWGAAIEQTSTERAETLEGWYKDVIAADTEYCLGSYVFLWGQKQERTPTWYGLFTEDGEQMEAIDVMHYYWTGQWPTNRCPQVTEPLLADKSRFDQIQLGSEKLEVVTFHAMDPDGDSLRVRVEVMHEATDLSNGGDHEKRPQSLEGLVKETTLGRVSFLTPKQTGDYRIYIYVTDGHDHAATFNIPFQVVNNTAAL